MSCTIRGSFWKCVLSFQKYIIEFFNLTLVYYFVFIVGPKYKDERALIFFIKFHNRLNYIFIIFILMHFSKVSCRKNDYVISILTVEIPFDLYERN